MGVEPFLSGGACCRSIGVNSASRRGPAKPGHAESNLPIGDGKRPDTQFARPNSSAARALSASSNLRRKPVRSAGMISSSIPANYRGIEKKHYPTIVGNAQHNLGQLEGACQIHVSFMLGFWPLSRAQPWERPCHRNRDRPARRIQTCRFHQPVDAASGSAEWPGLNPTGLLQFRSAPWIGAPSGCDRRRSLFVTDPPILCHSTRCTGRPSSIGMNKANGRNSRARMLGFAHTAVTGGS